MIERLRAVKWEVIDEGDRMPDDPTHKCVFVDMRPDDFRALLREAAAALEAAREDVCVSLVADIRWACGDNGKRMQPELVEFIRELTADAERWRALRELDGGEIYALLGDCDGIHPEQADAAIDQARGKGVAE